MLRRSTLRLDATVTKVLSGPRKALTARVISTKTFTNRLPPHQICQIGGKLRVLNPFSCPRASATIWKHSLIKTLKATWCMHKVTMMNGRPALTSKTGRLILSALSSLASTLLMIPLFLRIVADSITTLVSLFLTRMKAMLTNVSCGPRAIPLIWIMTSQKCAQYNPGDAVQASIVCS